MEFIRTIHIDPLVVNVAPRPKGAKGHRVLQGEQLTRHLRSIISRQDNIISSLRVLLDSVRRDFPRLYMVSDDELTSIVSLSDDPRALVPIVKKLFGGICNLRFSLPKNLPSINQTLDMELNARLLEVTGLISRNQEEVDLLDRINPSHNIAEWLSKLERTSKNTIHNLLEGCLETRLDNDEDPYTIMEQLEKAKATKNDVEKLVVNIKNTFQHWLLRFPLQCVLLSEAIIWSKSVKSAVKDSSETELRSIRGNKRHCIDQYVTVVRENMQKETQNDNEKRLHTVLYSLISQALYHRDIVENILAKPCLEKNDFGWWSSIKYEAYMEAGLSPTLCGKSVANRQKMREVEVHQLDQTFRYEYEYLPPTQRLIITPLTERCFIGLAKAIKDFRFPSVCSGKGFGGSSTVKEFLAVIGRPVFTVQCSKHSTTDTLTRSVIGALSSGSGVFFDEMESLSINNLSLLGEYFQNISNTMKLLNSQDESEYLKRGRARFDVTFVGDEKLLPNNDQSLVVRRNSLNTLHSLPAMPAPAGRQSTVPHGFNEEGLHTYFEQTWIKEKETRRHSVYKEIGIRDYLAFSNRKRMPFEYESIYETAISHQESFIYNWSYKPSFCGHVIINGKLVRANSTVTIFTTLDSNRSFEIPSNLSSFLRPVSLKVMDARIVIERYLFASGFPSASNLAKRFAILLDLVKEQLKDLYTGFTIIKTILQIANSYYQYSLQLQASKSDGSVDYERDEEASLVKAIRNVLSSKLIAYDYQRLNELIRDSFPHNSRPRSAEFDMKFNNVLEEQIRLKKMNVRKQMIDKILQLYTAIQTKQPVLISGVGGSGKTTMYSLLADALTSLAKGGEVIEKKEISMEPQRGLSVHMANKLKVLKSLPADEKIGQQAKKWQKIGAKAGATADVQAAMEVSAHSSIKSVEGIEVDLEVVLPNAYASTDLVGYYKGRTFQRGILHSIFTTANEQLEVSQKSQRKKQISDESNSSNSEHPLQKWIVFNGDLNADWMEPVSCVFDQTRCLRLPDSSTIFLNGNYI